MGLNGSLLGVRSEAAGFDLTITGVIMAAYFVGFPGGHHPMPNVR